MNGSQYTDYKHTQLLWLGCGSTDLHRPLFNFVFTDFGPNLARTLSKVSLHKAALEAIDLLIFDRPHQVIAWSLHQCLKSLEIYQEYV